MADLFSDREKMRIIHHVRNFYLFDEDGRPLVLKKWVSRAAGTSGQVMEERGDLDSEHIPKDTRNEMRRTWEEYVSWKAVNS